MSCGLFDHVGRLSIYHVSYNLQNNSLYMYSCLCASHHPCDHLLRSSCVVLDRSSVESRVVKANLVVGGQVPVGRTKLGGVVGKSHKRISTICRSNTKETMSLRSRQAAQFRIIILLSGPEHPMFSCSASACQVVPFFAFALSFLSFSTLSR